MSTQSQTPLTPPNWTSLALVKVEAKGAGLWTLAFEYVPSARLLRFQVVDKDSANNSVQTDWKVNGETACSANGISGSLVKSNLMCTAAPQGALIAKIGGSSVDTPDSSQASAPYGGKKVFPVGSFCVYVPVANDPAGPLFLTMNDTPESFKLHSGVLYVQIDYATV
jgi:hypothetical protein